MGAVANFLLRRVFISMITIWVISIISFVIIQLPPGDFVSSYIAQLVQSGAIGSTADADQLRADYGLDQPLYIRYIKWALNALRGDFGLSLQWNRPVADLIGDYLGVTLLLTLTALILSWVLAFPIGVYTAMNRGSVGDYVVSTFGMIGVAVPNFLLALGALYVAFRYFNVDLGAINSPRYVDAPMSFGKAMDALGRILLPAFILALAVMARLIRILRANLLDELSKPYVVTARAKGMRELSIVLKYPARIALNPFVSTLGMMLPQLISGSIIVSLVLNSPSLGPLLLQALQAQDMFLASAILLILATITVIGTLISDLLLAWLDPRIRLQY